MKALLSLSVLLFAAAAFAGPQEAGKPAEACEKQHAQCMKQCDKEKRAWFFKGEAYDNCAAKCEARTASCAATGMGDGAGDGTGDGTGDKTGRHRDHGRADAGGDASDSADQPQAEEIPESGEGDPDEASGKGKDRAGDRGRKDKDRDAAEDESGTEDDE